MIEEINNSISQYVCSTCGRAVILVKDEIIRVCDHTESGVTVNIEAVTYGIGTTQPKEKD